MDADNSWTSGLDLQEEYYQGIVEDFEGVLDKFRVATVSTYGTRKSRKNTSMKVSCTTHRESLHKNLAECLSLRGHGFVGEMQKFRRALYLCPVLTRLLYSYCVISIQELRLFWRKKEGTCDVSFNGIPFSVEEEKILDCQYGAHYFKKHVNDGSKPSRLKLQGTRKIGCLAKVTAKKYALYPEFKVCDALNDSTRGMKQRKHDVLEGLKASLSKDMSSVKIIYRFASQ